MKLKKQKTFILTLAIASLFSTMIYASSSNVESDCANIKKIYQNMTTSALEKEVERLTLKGDVPFDMGLELMKRWTKGAIKAC